MNCMPSDTLSNLIHRLSGVYRDPQRVLRDAETLLNSPLGHHLRPTTEPLMLNDGTSTPPVLMLSGTLPMTYRGVTYNLPIDMYLPPPYPLRPPTVFVRPVASMAIKENHRHVGLDGKVYLPYLHEWRPQSHDLRELAVWMSSTFGDEPPCYAKPANQSGGGGGGRSNPPPYAQASVTSAYNPNAVSNSVRASVVSTSTILSNSMNSEEEQRRIAFEKEIAEANLAAETARKAAAEEARLEEESKRLKLEHDANLSNMRAMATSKVQFQIQQIFKESKEEMRRELKDQKLLEVGKERIDMLLKEGEEQKNGLIRDIAEMDKAVEELEQWLEAVEEQKRNTGEDTSSSEQQQQQRQQNVDLLALPTDTHSAQMLELSAKNAAIDDCIYYLDRALVRGSITLDVFLKEVRKLSKEQFLAKAHLLKIAQAKFGTDIRSNQV